MKFLYHCNPHTVEERIDLATYVIPPHKAYKFENDFHAHLFLEHMSPCYGVIEMKQMFDEDKGTFNLDMEDAKERAQVALDEAEERMIESYARIQLEDRVSQGKPAIAPSDRLKAIIERRHVDLGERFGVYPIGFGKSKVQVERENEMSALREQNANLTEKIAFLMSKMVEAGVIEEADTHKGKRKAG